MPAGSQGRRGAACSRGGRLTCEAPEPAHRAHQDDRADMSGIRVAGGLGSTRGTSTDPRPQDDPRAPATHDQFGRASKPGSSSARAAAARAACLAHGLLVAPRRDRDCRAVTTEKNAKNSAHLIVCIGTNSPSCRPAAVTPLRRAPVSSAGANCGDHGRVERYRSRGGPTARSTRWLAPRARGARPRQAP